MVHSTKGRLETVILDKDMELKYGLMVPDMKGIGKTELQQAEGNSSIQMVIFTKVFIFIIFTNILTG